MRNSAIILEELKRLEWENDLHRKAIKENQPIMESLSMEYDKALEKEAKSVFIANESVLKEVGRYL